MAAHWGSTVETIYTQSYQKTHFNELSVCVCESVWWGGGFLCQPGAHMSFVTAARSIVQAGKRDSVVFVVQIKILATWSNIMSQRIITVALM